MRSEKKELWKTSMHDEMKSHHENKTWILVEKFNMNGANSVSTPMETNWSESNIGNYDCNAPYREAVGNLMFLQTVSRPDISFAINIASGHLENPNKYQWKLVKRILRYIKGTADMGLLYTKAGSLETFSDADYAGITTGTLLNPMD
ncbi:secreted RxLR effector protein 161-like [Bombus pyrosoma]|uniref:secreted RxLR effector protein 161-like n=1 Tax=Bombus pyrosoma TaxID=396416 RepID=UPI001CB88F52|nr:secreted RxLR effector protein 161-like [Bombus pyrosoma]